MHKNRMRKLTKILPPPKEPLDWDESMLARNQEILGVGFPKDFVEFGRRYGSGTIDSAYSWEVWSPCRRVYPFMVMQFARKWNLYKDAMEVTHLPFGLFPEVGGLLPFATTDGGDYVCWRTVGEPDEWNVVDFGYYDSGGYEELALGFSEYFLAVLSREIVLERHRTGQCWDPNKDLRFRQVVYDGGRLCEPDDPSMKRLSFEG